jgi:hypothetical protein
MSRMQEAAFIALSFYARVGIVGAIILLVLRV